MTRTQILAIIDTYRGLAAQFNMRDPDAHADIVFAALWKWEAVLVEFDAVHS